MCLRMAHRYALRPGLIMFLINHRFVAREEERKRVEALKSPAFARRVPKFARCTSLPSADVRSNNAPW